ncbi:hypothetical protein LOC67_26365 [Stieleria sp. JC731]|uniref:hypothetical protein n=1 Tax=Pirellulaceae TaxID=2691357 RepID=UPI001E383EAD|nr:hypothetical protein [Stieleria sp. JC731]MCC9604093.1 hypothetical protein [Stieleria sp. JC731]
MNRSALISIRWLIAVAIGFVSAQASHADDADRRAPLVQRLLEPHSGQIDGQSLRIAVQLVGDIGDQPARHLNIWIDRKVNPDTLVSPGNLGPTRFASLEKIAEAVNCKVYPIDNCILFGRPQWVAKLSQELLQTAASAPEQNDPINFRSDTISVYWPDLTTPHDAFEAILSQASTGSNLTHEVVSRSFTQLGLTPDLPHDLWPATSLVEINPLVAATLVAGQFQDLEAKQAEAIKFERCYRFPNVKTQLEKLRQRDPAAKLRLERDGANLLADFDTHRELFSQLLASETKDKANDAAAEKTNEGNPLQRLKNDSRTFTLTVSNKPTGAVLAQLFSTAKVDYEFAPTANPELTNLISFEAKDQTLWQLVHLIAKKSSLKIQAAEQTLLVLPQRD